MEGSVIKVPKKFAQYMNYLSNRPEKHETQSQWETVSMAYVEHTLRHIQGTAAQAAGSELVADFNDVQGIIPSRETTIGSLWESDTYPGQS